jgi:hypothetical protein
MRYLRSGLKIHALLVVGVLGLCSTPLLQAQAAFDVFLPFNLYGQQPNLCPPSNPQGICAAVASINSFAFLQNQYPGIYGTSLLPNLQNDGTDPTDALAFGTTGWQVGGNPARQGYYPRPGNAYSDYIQTKRDWIEDHAPGRTVYEVRYAGAGGAPDVAWLAEQIQNGQDVEFFVQGTDFFHALTLTGIGCSDHNYVDCYIKYQDPNDPDTEYQLPINPTGPSGALQLTGVLGDGGVTLTITGAFAESPVPEPATLVLIGGALVGLAYYRRRRRA